MLKVIIVDNDANFRKALKSVLVNIGDVEIIAEASNGKEVLDLFPTHMPDLIFMDIKMPEINGIEATKKIKTLYPNIDIVGISSYADDEYKNEMLNSGASFYLLKSDDNYNKLKSIIELKNSVNNVGLKPNNMFNL